MRTLKVSIVQLIMIALLISSHFFENDGLGNIALFLYWTAIVVLIFRSSKTTEILNKYIQDHPIHKITYLFNAANFFGLLYFGWSMTAFTYLAAMIYALSQLKACHDKSLKTVENEDEKMVTS